MNNEISKLEGTIIWIAPFYNRTGFGVDARSVVSALTKEGVRIRTVPVNQVEEGIDDCDMNLIKSLESTPIIPPVTLIVSHVADKSWLDIKIPEPNLKIIATTVFECTSEGCQASEKMLDACKEFDQVWIMSHREREAFITNGFAPEKIRLVAYPHPWRENPLLPSVSENISSSDKPFRFLNISLFLPRRRWDSLIEAHLEEFKNEDNVELYLKVNYPWWHPVPGKPREDLFKMINSLKQKTGSKASIIVDENLGTRSDIVRIIDSCDAYISTDTFPTAPITEARVRKRIVVLPNSFDVVPPEGYVSFDDTSTEKIQPTEEMMQYQPDFRKGYLPLLNVNNIRKSMRYVYSMSAEEKNKIIDYSFSCTYGPADTVPNIINSIKAGWEYKNSLELNAEINSYQNEPTVDNHDSSENQSINPEEKQVVNQTGMNKLRLNQNIQHGFSNNYAFGKLPFQLPSPLNLNLGCGKDIKEGFLNIDLFSEDPRVIAMDIRKLEFPDNSVDMILASDILEHFSFREVDSVLSEWARVLKPNAEIIIRSPSLKLQMKAYLHGQWDADVASYMIFGGQTNPGDYHHIGFDENSIRKHLAKVNLDLHSYREVNVPQDKGYCNLNFIAGARKHAVKNNLTANSNLNGKLIWEGPQFAYHSLALINREITSRLIQRKYNISLKPSGSDQFFPSKNEITYNNKKFYNKFNEAEITVRHQWPPDLLPPASGYWINIQPWEYGSLPETWADVFKNQVDEMWVPSNYVKKVYIDSGVPGDRVFVIPNGVDTNKFNPSAKPYKLKTKKKMKFLFVGGTIYRKGIDILLEAYSETFSSNDDVCLVIKDMGGQSFYNGQTAQSIISEIKKKGNTPEIEYIDKNLNEKELIGLYTACNVLVHPYRGEGFGLPVLEAMACGLPVIVTEGGATDDFCKVEFSFKVESSTAYVNEKKIDNMSTVNYPWLLTPVKEDLINKMKYAYNNLNQLKEMGSKAAEFAKNNYGWDKIVDIIEERISKVTQKKIVRFVEKKQQPLEMFGQQFSKMKAHLDNKEVVEARDSLYSAIEYFKKIEDKTNIDIDYQTLLNLAGNINLALNDLESAQKYFEELLNIDPGSSEACLGLGLVFKEAGMYEQSKVMLEWAVKYDSQNMKARNFLTSVNKLLGLPEYDFSLDKETTTEEADDEEIMLKTKATLSEVLSKVYEIFSEKQYHVALKALEDNKQLFYSQYCEDGNNEIISAYENLKGLICLSLNDNENARISFESALQLNPESSQACAGLGEIFYLEGKDKEAKTMYEFSVKNNSDNQFALAGLAKVNYQLGYSPVHNTLITENE